MSRTIVPLASLLLGCVLMSAAGVSAAPTAERQVCQTPVYQNGLDLVFKRASSQAAADTNTQGAQRVGFSGVKTVQESCGTWKTVLRGLDSFDTAVEVQSEARRVHLFPTIECVVAEEIGQLQAIFGTRRTLDELAVVIQLANSFGYIGLKTKSAPCGGYQAYIAGFETRAEADSFAQTAGERTGLPVTIIKA